MREVMREMWLFVDVMNLEMSHEYSIDSRQQAFPWVLTEKPDTDCSTIDIDFAK
jgi:hypothetical protein